MSRMKVMSGQKYQLERGSQGPPGPAYPKYLKAYINPGGDLPYGGTTRRGQG